MLALALSYTSVGWLSHLVMPNHSLNVILKLGSKEKRRLSAPEPWWCMCGSKACSDAKVLLALVVPHKLCASVSVQGWGDTPYNREGGGRSTCLHAGGVDLYRIYRGRGCRPVFSVTALSLPS